jgi:hypothetical protein
MKKGLLGLLVVALTMVGCQNYDDQFDDLNSKISSLATTVDGLLAVQTSVTALSTKLDNLASTALTDSDLTAILTEVTTVKAAVAALETTDVTGIETEVAGLNLEVDDILTKLNELLTANAVINQNIRITSLAELGLAEDLISTGADDPNVTINGSLIVNTTGTSDITGAAIITRLNAVLGKIKVVMKTVTVTTDEALAAVNLQYIQGDLDIAAEKGSMAVVALTTVTGAMTINQTGNLLMSTLNSVAGGITINTSNVTITSVDLSGLTEGAVITSAGKLELPNATSVKISSVLPATVSAAKATTFESASQTAQGSTTITVDGSTSFSLGSASFSGAVVITAKGGVNLAGVTSAKALTITSDGAVSLGGLTKITETTAVSATSVNIGAVTSIEASTVVTSTDVTLSALTSVSSPSALVAETLKLVGPTTVSLPLLASAAGNIVAASATTFAAVSLATSTGTITPKAAATVHLKSLNNPTKISTLANVVDLKLTAQTGIVSLVTAIKLVKLDYTGLKDSTPNPGGQANELAIGTANASLTTLIIGDGGLGKLTVDNSKLTALTTAGVIITTDVKNNAALETFNLGHTYLEGDNALTISVVANVDPLFVTLDMSTMQKVKHVNITGNTSLTTIKAPSSAVLAEPVAQVTLTLDGNLTTGTYTAAVAGSETSSHTMATLTAETATGFKTLYTAYKGQSTRVAGTVTMSIEIDSETAKITGDAVAQTAGANNQLVGNSGKIDDDKETALLTD